MEPREPIYILSFLLLCKEMETIWWSAKKMHRIENFQVFFKLLIISFRDNRWALDPLETQTHTQCVCAVCLSLHTSLVQFDSFPFIRSHTHSAHDDSDFNESRTSDTKEGKKQTISTQQKCFFFSWFSLAPTGSIKFISQKKHHANKKVLSSNETEIKHGLESSIDNCAVILIANKPSFCSKESQLFLVWKHF